MLNIIVGKGDLGSALAQQCALNNLKYSWVSQDEFWSNYVDTIDEDCKIFYTPWITDVDAWELNANHCLHYLENYVSNVLQLSNNTKIEKHIKKFVYYSSNMAEIPVINGYGYGKLLAENETILSFANKASIIRTQYLYGGKKKWDYPQSAVDMWIRPVNLHELAKWSLETDLPVRVDFYGEAMTMHEFVSMFNKQTEPCLFGDIEFKTNRRRVN